MFELVPSDLAGTRAALSRLPIILDANVFGDSLHVRVSDETADRNHSQDIGD